ncbi:Uncharacterised protein [Bordetella ansorpii]|uniref:Uncharacterized protein n=1 Tax=Bordetella ansorpii TaxID=288768 RepID=A0A157S5U8_9BORD|nr:hypothetical protein [Bordetella ansorpii]SAI65755.1 Uncharacterised protein [Bordetella ansorpii]
MPVDAYLPNSMRALAIDRYGGPDVVQRRDDAPVPAPAASAN